MLRRGVGIVGGAAGRVNRAAMTTWGRRMRIVIDEREK